MSELMEKLEATNTLIDALAVLSDHWGWDVQGRRCMVGAVAVEFARHLLPACPPPVEAEEYEDCEPDEREDMVVAETAARREDWFAEVVGSVVDLLHCRVKWDGGDQRCCGRIVSTYDIRFGVILAEPNRPLSHRNVARWIHLCGHDWMPLS